MKKIFIILSPLILASCTTIGTQVTNTHGTVQMSSAPSQNRVVSSNPPKILQNSAANVAVASKQQNKAKPEIKEEIEIISTSRQIINSYVIIQ